MESDPQRDRQIRDALAEARLDALICRLPENLVCLAGYYPHVGLSFVVYPAIGAPVAIVPRPEVPDAERGLVGDIHSFDTWRIRDAAPLESVGRILADVAGELNLLGGRVGFEGSFEAVSPSQLAGELFLGSAPTRDTIARVIGADPIDATDVLNQIRSVKTPREIEKLRLAYEVATLGLRVFREQARPGRTEAQVAAAVEAEFYARGIGYGDVRYAWGWAQVFSGPNTIEGWFYPVSSARVIESGDLVVIELGTVVDGYWSDLTRTIAAGGKASSLQRELYDRVAEAQRASLLAARPGVLGKTADAAGRDLLALAGLGEYFAHHTGHGIGFRYHEPIPSVHPASSDVLRVGHVHSIEPGIYAPEFGGIRVEDIAVVLDGGAEFLSRREFDLE